jgi:hypothetical protein
MLETAKSSFQENKHIMIDNSKPLLKAFDKLAQNELFKDVLI